MAKQTGASLQKMMRMKNKTRKKKKTKPSQKSEVKVEEPPKWEPTGPFRLLDLPTELWLKVVEFAVTQPERRIDIDNPGTNEIFKLTKPPAIACVSRQIRKEALVLFYGINDIVLHDQGKSLKKVRQWLNGIGLVNRTRLQRFYITSDQDDIWKEVHRLCRGRHEVEHGCQPEGSPEESPALKEITVRLSFKATKGIIL